MSLHLILGPQAYPVSIAQMKSHLRIQHDDDDTLIDAMIAAAVKHLDGQTGILQRALVEQTWEYRRPTFCARMEIPLPPLRSVESVKYLDGDGVEQTVDAEDYVIIDQGYLPSVIRPSTGVVWPSVTCRDDALRITFSAGYVGVVNGGLDGVFPETIRIAIILIVADWYENRETVSTQNVNAIPMAAPVQALLSPYKIPVLA